MVDRIGTAIAGYRIESLIARGGMGDVYLATQSFPERKVTLKILPHDLASDQTFRERFTREPRVCRLSRALEHRPRSLGPGDEGFNQRSARAEERAPGGPSPSTRHR